MREAVWTQKHNYMVILFYRVFVNTVRPRKKETHKSS